MLFQRSDHRAKREGHNNQTTDLRVSRELQDWNRSGPLRSRRRLSRAIHGRAADGTANEDATWIHVLLPLQTRGTHIRNTDGLDKRI